jgi:DNA-binding MarR family transcriptional regulator
MQATAATPSDPAVTALARDLNALTRFLLRRSSPDVFQGIAELELSMTHVKVLHVLDGPVTSELSLKDLADHFSTSLATISRTVEDLVQRRYVEREEDAHDRRIKRVRITPAGRDVVSKINETRMAVLEQFLATLTEPQRRRLAAALAPIVAREDVGSCRPKGLTR